MTEQQYNNLKQFEAPLKKYVEININVGFDVKKLAEFYKEIDPNEQIDLWCSGCVDVLMRRSYDLIKEYERLSNSK
jgi:hypothetical protein